MLHNCNYCNYATDYKQNMRRHMETKHSHMMTYNENHHIPSKGSVECNDLGEALEVWKIYKLLQRMNNK